MSARIVVDTDVLIAAIRSPSGASAAVVNLVLDGRLTMLVSVALFLEYEAVALRPQHRNASKASELEVLQLLDTLLLVSHPVEVSYQWRPQLPDPDDEMVLEAAVNGNASAIVTFNQRDFGQSGSRFGIAILKSGNLIRRIRE